LSYRQSFTNWLGDREYETIETPDEDYDRMKQEELDEQMKEAHDSDTTGNERQIEL
jgi:hypothetical protein